MRGWMGARRDPGKVERGLEKPGRGRLVSDYLAKISLKCCSCGNDIIRVRQGQLAVIKAGQRGKGAAGGGQPRGTEGMNEIKAGSEDGRLHGSTSGRLSVPRQLKRICIPDNSSPDGCPLPPFNPHRSLSLSLSPSFSHRGRDRENFPRI